MEDKKYQLPKEFGEKWVKALREMPEDRRAKDFYEIHLNGKLCYCGIGLGLYANDISCLGPFLNLIDGLTDLHDTITDLNDNQDYTFEQQADWIEQNVNFI